MPFSERATHKCEMPRRSSTRQSSNVEPSGKRVAPALKILLTEYGQSFPVKIGLAEWRRNSISYCCIAAFIVASPRFLNYVFESVFEEEGCTVSFRAYSLYRRILPTVAFPGAPSEKTTWTQPLDFHWRGRDATHLCNLQKLDRKERSEDRCLPETN